MVVVVVVVGAVACQWDEVVVGMIAAVLAAAAVAWAGWESIAAWPQVAGNS